MNECPVCHTGQLEETHVETCMQGSGRWLLFRRVPALKCDVCGETTFSQQVSERLAQIAASTPSLRPTSMVFCPVYELEELDGRELVGVAAVQLADEKVMVSASTISDPTFVAMPDPEVRGSGTTAPVLMGT